MLPLLEKERTAQDGGVRILLVEDHRLLRDGLARILVEAGFEVVGETGEGDEALRLAERLRPHIVLAADSVSANGQGAVDALRSRAPDGLVVVLAAEADREAVERARVAGAAGYVLKDASSREVVSALTRVAAGVNVFVRAGFGAQPEEEADEPSPAAPELTDRETEILQLLAGGSSPAEVAEGLAISPKTVRNHLSNAYDALQVSSRAQAIVVALRHGLIELPGA